MVQAKIGTTFHKSSVMPCTILYSISLHFMLEILYAFLGISSLSRSSHFVDNYFKILVHQEILVGNTEKAIKSNI